MKKYCVALALLVQLVPFEALAGGVSVALSDNLVVLDSRHRSSAIELVNLSADPTEYKVTCPAYR